MFSKISKELEFHSRLLFILSDDCPKKDNKSSSPRKIKIIRMIKQFLLSQDNFSVPVKIKIIETIMIKNEVYNGWLCWYNASKKMNSEFENKYMAAISRSRTTQEIEGESLFVKREQALTAILKDIEKMNLNDRCSICLEDLSEEEENKGGLKSLECSHIFHGNCIKKWILRDDEVSRHNTKCPLCRGNLHSDCTAELCPILN